MRGLIPGEHGEEEHFNQFIKTQNYSLEIHDLLGSMHFLYIMETFVPTFVFHIPFCTSCQK